MLCNSEKMGMLPTDEWTQRMMIGERFMMHNNTTTTSNSTSPGTNNIFNRTAPPSSSSSSSSAAAARAMVQQQEQHTAAASPPLKCPRCDSSNTKFCYYNNYNLSQPRHFCKACKRYWTRGGTLRNVPVGGGCRKNKRVKKAPTASTSAATAPHTDPPPAPLIPPLSLPTASHIDASVSRSDLNSFIYGLPSTSSDMNLAAFPGLQSIACTAYDLQPQLNALGPGFPTTQRDDEQYQSGFGTNLTDLQQSATFLNGYSNLESHLSSATGASLLVSNIKQPKRVEDYQALLTYEDLQASENGNFGLLKEVKVEGGQSNVMGSHSMDWQVPCEIYPFDAINAAASVSDSSYLYWNPAVGGAAWPDAANSSVAPLI